MSVWVVEELDREDDRQNNDWFPLWMEFTKSEAKEAASERRAYIREVNFKRVKVRIREYVPKEIWDMVREMEEAD